MKRKAQEKRFSFIFKWNKCWLKTGKIEENVNQPEETAVNSFQIDNTSQGG